MIELVPHIRLDCDDVLTVTNPSLLRDARLADDYVTQLVDRAPDGIAPYLVPDDDALSLSINLGGTAAVNAIHTMGAKQLLGFLGGMLWYHEDDGDAVLSVRYSESQNSAYFGNFVGVVHPSLQDRLQQGFIGEESMRRVARAMMLGFATSDEIVRQLRAANYYATNEGSGAESITCDNHVRIDLRTRPPYDVVLPTFETLGDATNWIITGPNSDKHPKLVTHNLDTHNQVFSYVLGAAALVDVAMTK